MQINISERKRSADRAWQRANHDALSELPNRSLLLDRLAQALALARRHGGEGALLCIDVEHLDRINESLGHDAGDEVLRHVARGLRASVRRSDSAARIGEDEFAVLVPRLGDGAVIEALTEKLTRALSGEVELGGREVPLRVTIGAVRFPSADETAEQVLSAARETVRRGGAAQRPR
jgi:diguanylate cyclase (GGDEF)-like protein